MRLTVLGSGTGLPDADRGPSGFAIEADADTWWIDGGSGTLQRSTRCGIDPCTLTGGLYTHLHPDHAADLAAVLFARRLAGVEQPYHLVGGVGLSAHLDRLRDTWGSAIDTPVEVTELSLQAREDRRLGTLRLRTAPANHGASALHLRLDSGGHSLCLSGDTGPSEGLAALATGTDLFVCECALVEDDPYTKHLRPSEVVDIVRRARPAAVWLTHFYPDADPDRAVRAVGATGVPTRRAEDGDVWVSTAAHR